jgi:hypothetical protein
MTQQAAPLSISELRDSLKGPGGSSQIVEERIITLKTNPSKHTLGWSNEEIARAFKELFMHSYAKLNDKDKQIALDEKANMYRDEVIHNMQNVSKGILALTTKWEQELAELEHRINNKYSNPIEVTLNPSTPQEHEFISLVEAFDYFVIIQDNLWMAKSESIEAKNRVQQAINKKISSFVSNARTKARIIRNIRMNKPTTQESTLEPALEATA